MRDGGQDHRSGKVVSKTIKRLDSPFSRFPSTADMRSKKQPTGMDPNPSKTAKVFSWLRQKSHELEILGKLAEIFDHQKPGQNSRDFP